MRTLAVDTHRAMAIRRYRRECFTAMSNIELVDDNGDTLKLAMPDPIVIEKEVIKEKKSILVWQI